MPNHVTTRCTVTGPLEDIERFRAACILKDHDDDGGRLFLDFNAIIPMPEAVKGTVSGNQCDLGVEILTGHMKPPVFETIEQLKAWVERSIANWGTKWIGIDEPIAGVLRFRFDTAWSFPEPVFNKLADDYPTLKFECVCYDEGSNFAGEGFFNGEPEFATCEATDELYERVYGHQREDEDETTDNDR